MTASEPIVIIVASRSMFQTEYKNFISIKITEELVNYSKLNFRILNIPNINFKWENSEENFSENAIHIMNKNYKRVCELFWVNYLNFKRTKYKLY